MDALERRNDPDDRELTEDDLGDVTGGVMMPDPPLAPPPGAL